MVALSPMTLDLKSEEVPSHATALGEVALSPVTRDLKNEEVPSHATALEEVVASCPTTTNSLSPTDSPNATTT